jgi:type I restriction enzyme S subunit
MTVGPLTERTIGDAYGVTKKPRNLSRRGDKAVPFLTMAAIPQDGSRAVSYQMLPMSQIGSGTYFEPGDVLVSKITPCFENGKQAIADDLPGDYGYATTEVIPLHPRSDEDDPRFLFYYLLHPRIRSEIASRMEGSTARLRIPDDILLGYPLPDIKGRTQRSIADALDTVQVAIRAEEELTRNCHQIKLIAMRYLFMHGLRLEEQKETVIGAIPESWNVSTIGEHFSVLSGGTPSRGISTYWQSGTIPWVKTSEVNYRLITDTEELITKTALAQSAAKLLPAGIVLMAMYGQGVTRGKVAILGIDAACNQACAAMLPLDDCVLTRYLFHFLAYRYEEIRRLSHGGQQQNLNLDIVRDLHLAIPDLKTEQQEIADTLDTIDASVRLHERKRAVLEDLFESLLNGLMISEIDVNNLNFSVLELRS